MPKPYESVFKKKLYTIKQRPETNEYHIFESYKDTEGKCVIKNPSICKKVSKGNPVKDYTCMTEDDVRIKAAELFVGSVWVVCIKLIEQ